MSNLLLENGETVHGDLLVLVEVTKHCRLQFLEPVLDAVDLEKEREACALILQNTSHFPNEDEILLMEVPSNPEGTLGYGEIDIQRHFPWN